MDFKYIIFVFHGLQQYPIISYFRNSSWSQALDLSIQGVRSVKTWCTNGGLAPGKEATRRPCYYLSVGHSESSPQIAKFSLFPHAQASSSRLPHFHIEVSRKDRAEKVVGLQVERIVAASKQQLGASSLLLQSRV